MPKIPGGISTNYRRQMISDLVVRHGSLSLKNIERYLLRELPQAARDDLEGKLYKIISEDIKRLVNNGKLKEWSRSEWEGYSGRSVESDPDGSIPRKIISSITYSLAFNSSSLEDRGITVHGPSSLSAPIIVSFGLEDESENPQISFKFTDRIYTIDIIKDEMPLSIIWGNLVGTTYKKQEKYFTDKVGKRHIFFDIPDVKFKILDTEDKIPVIKVEDRNTISIFQIDNPIYDDLWPRKIMADDIDISDEELKKMTANPPIECIRIPFRCDPLTASLCLINEGTSTEALTIICKDLRTSQSQLISRKMEGEPIKISKNSLFHIKSNWFAFT